MLAPEALRVAGHGERKAEETDLRLRPRAVRTDGLDEAWAPEHAYVDTAPGSITRLAAIANPTPRRNTRLTHRSLVLTPAA
jgi:hypothetical protein